MTLYLEKDPKFAYKSGYQKHCNLWSGWRKNYLKLDWNCNTRCGWGWLIHMQWTELPGRCLKCVHFVYFCVAGLRFLCLPRVSCSCAWANVKFVLCSACSLTLSVALEQIQFSKQMLQCYKYILMHIYLLLHISTFTWISTAFYPKYGKQWLGKIHSNNKMENGLGSRQWLEMRIVFI